MLVRAEMLALLAGLGLAPLPTQVADTQSSGQPRPKSEFVFRGRVLDRETLQPVPGLQARRVDGKVEARTDGQGVIAFPMDEGDFGGCHWSDDGSVSCSMDDPETTRFVLRGSGTSPMLVAPRKYRTWEQTATLLVWRSGSIDGRWLDADGKPVANRKLAIESGEVLPLESEEQFADLVVTTDGKGCFRFDQVAARVKWSLRPADKEDKLVELDAASFSLTPGGKLELTVRSLPMASVSGVVRDAKGNPRPEAGVVLVGKQGNMYATSAADGTFAFEHVGAGAHRLKAMYPDEYDGIQESCVTTLQVGASERELHVALGLAPVEEISGRVLDAHGKPVDDAEIWFEPEAEPYSGRADVEENGSFRLAGLFVGECRLMASGPDRASRSAALTVKTGTKDLDLRLEPTGRLSGRVVLTVPIRQGKLSIYAECVSPRPAVEGLDPGGTSLLVELEAGESTFEFTDVPCGSWRVEASVDGELVSAESLVTVDADKETTCPDAVLKPSADLWLVAGPALGSVAIEVWSSGALQLRSELAEECVGLLHVSAGTLRVVARGPSGSVLEREVTIASGTQQLVGLGFGN